jgi:hypothetical protein
MNNHRLLIPERFVCEFQKKWAPLLILNKVQDTSSFQTKDLVDVTWSKIDYLFIPNASGGAPIHVNKCHMDKLISLLMQLNFKVQDITPSQEIIRRINLFTKTNASFLSSYLRVTNLVIKRILQQVVQITLTMDSFLSKEIAIFGAKHLLPSSLLTPELFVPNEQFVSPLCIVARENKELFVELYFCLRVSDAPLIFADKQTLFPVFKSLRWILDNDYSKKFVSYARDNRLYLYNDENGYEYEGPTVICDEIIEFFEKMLRALEDEFWRCKDDVQKKTTPNCYNVVDLEENFDYYVPLDMIELFEKDCLPHLIRINSRVKIPLDTMLCKLQSTECGDNISIMEIISPLFEPDVIFKTPLYIFKAVQSAQLEKIIQTLKEKNFDVASCASTCTHDQIFAKGKGIGNIFDLFVYHTRIRNQSITGFIHDYCSYPQDDYFLPTLRWVFNMAINLEKIPKTRVNTELAKDIMLGKPYDDSMSSFLLVANDEGNTPLHFIVMSCNGDDQKTRPFHQLKNEKELIKIMVDNGVKLSLAPLKDIVLSFSLARSIKRLSNGEMRDAFNFYEQVINQVNEKIKLKCPVSTSSCSTCF